MEMPGYTDYGKMYEMNPGAFFQAQEQLDLAKQFQQAKQAQQQAVTRGQELSNIFEEKNMPTKLQKGQMELEGMGYENRGKKVDIEKKERLAPLDFSAAEKELLNKATKADLDGIEYMGQRMAYSNDPQVRAQGETLLKRHKDYLKFYEQSRLKREEEEQAQKNRIQLEGVRQAGQDRRAQAIQKARAEARGGTDKMTTDQLRAHYIRLAQEAQSRGEYDVANDLYGQAQYITQMRAFERPDPMAGKPDVASAAGLPTVPQREAPTPPGQAPRQAKPPASLSEVQKLYPGVPPERLREAYKKKFGVELE